MSSTSISLIMMASKPETVFQAVRHATQVFPNYRELLIAAAPSLPSDVVDGLSTLARVRCIPGTDSVEQAGEVRYRLLDEAVGDWIVNIDDDDLWFHSPADFAALPPDVGLVGGGVIFARFFGDPRGEASVICKPSRAMTRPADATALSGSFWAVRRAAWRQLSPHVERLWWFSDWRLAYGLRYLGWKYHSTPQVLGVVRSYGYNYPTGPEWDWSVYVRKLEEQLRRRGLSPRTEPLST